MLKSATILVLVRKKFFARIFLALNFPRKSRSQNKNGAIFLELSLPPRVLVSRQERSAFGGWQKHAGAGMKKRTRGNM